MDGVPVDRVRIHLLVIVKDAIAPEGAGANHMPVGQDIAPLGIHHESCRLGVESRVGVEGAGLAEADGDDVAHDILNGRLPLCRVGPQRGQGLQGGLLDVVVVSHLEIGSFYVGGVVAGRLLAIDRGTVVF